MASRAGVAALNRLELIGATAALGGRQVLNAVDLGVASGEFVAVVGPNGAGKSSAIRALAGLLPVASGEIRIDGDPIAKLSPQVRAERIAYLPQERRIAWNLPAIEVAALGAPFLSGAEARDRAMAALVELEAGDLFERGVAEMSGGERARVLLARALTADARSLLVDEAIAGLDPDAQLLVLERLRARARAGQAVLLSLHDLTLAARYADRVIVIHHGTVVADGPPLEALASATLKQVFGLRGGWVDDPGGPLLAVGRSQSGE